MKNTAISLATSSLTAILFLSACGSSEPSPYLWGGGGKGEVVDPPGSETPDTVGTLAGTWDIRSTLGSTTNVVLEISANHISATNGGTTARATMSGSTGTGTWTDRWTADGITINHINEGIDTGKIPIDLGGKWTMTRGGKQCTAALLPTRFTNSCNFPYGHIPAIGTISTNITAQRTSEANSIFGDLGGKWELTAGDGHCSVSLVDGTFTAQCNKGGQPETFSVVVNGNTASGTTSSGWEFVATRR